MHPLLPGVSFLYQNHVDSLLQWGLRAGSNLLSLVVVEDDRREEEDGVAEEPKEASLHRPEGRPQ